MHHPSAKKHMEVGTIALILVGCLLLAGLTGCSGSKKYQVDYCGAEFLYSNAKDSYRAGTTVTLYFELIATDTDYSFFLDGEPVQFTYDQKKGFIITFTMPEHDVKLEYNTVASMQPLTDGNSDDFGDNAPVSPGYPSPTNPSVGMWNPVLAITLDDFTQETGYDLNLPEDVFQELRVRRIDADPVIYSLAFVYEDGNFYNFRMAKGPDHGDISGMHYTWTETETSADPAYTVYLTNAGQGICLWCDQFFTFSVSMDGNATQEALTEMRSHMIRSWENAE